jgi:hypothetical protein
MVGAVWNISAGAGCFPNIHNAIFKVDVFHPEVFIKYIV